MSDLEPLEPSSIRHVVEPGLDRSGADGAAHGHLDYFFGEGPTALWARAYIGSMEAVAMHGLEAHDMGSDHVMRVLMYLGERFGTVEIFEGGEDGGRRPLPSRLQARLDELLAAAAGAAGEGIGGWDTPASRNKGG